MSSFKWTQLVLSSLYISNLVKGAHLWLNLNPPVLSSVSGKKRVIEKQFSSPRWVCIAAIWFLQIFLQCFFTDLANKWTETCWRCKIFWFVSLLGKCRISGEVKLQLPARIQWKCIYRNLILVLNGLLRMSSFCATEVDTSSCNRSYTIFGVVFFTYFFLKAPRQVIWV